LKQNVPALPQLFGDIQKEPPWKRQFLVRIKNRVVVYCAVRHAATELPVSIWLDSPWRYDDAVNVKTALAPHDHLLAVATPAPLRRIVLPLL
jgi:hypothetical protein